MGALASSTFLEPFHAASGEICHFESHSIPSRSEPNVTKVGMERLHSSGLSNQTPPNRGIPLRGNRDRVNWSEGCACTIDCQMSPFQGPI
jgi:hypothetical protein